MSTPQSRALLVTPIRMTASGVVFVGSALVSAIHIIAPGSAGNFAVYHGVDASADLRYPVTAYSALAAGQVIRFGKSASPFGSLYLTLPTSAVVLVYTAPR